MASTLWCCSLLLTLGQCVLGQEPHTLCYEDFRYAPDHIYPNDWHVIVDSYDYQDLFEDAISVWKLGDVDGDGRGWSDTFGGTCQKEIGVGSCSSGNPDNWFFTGFNSYDNAIEVIIDATFRWTRCSPGSCAKVAVYRYDTNGLVSESQQRDPNNYTPITGNEMTSRLQQNQPTNVDTNVELCFNRSEGFNGLYLGFRDTGACRGQIKRFQVYYPIAPNTTVGLLFCPEVPLVRGSSSSSTCRCAENSDTTGSLERVCSDSGVCSELPECECNGGYKISSNETTCVDCNAGTYRSLSQSQTSCSDCPENTDETQIAATQCECKDGFFRAEDEGPSDGCSQPPTAVLNLRVHEMTQTSITLHWEKPSTTSRPDFYYEVLRSDENTVSVYTLITTIQGGTRSTVEYEDTGLTPATTYVYRVIVHNGVSDQDPLNVHLRTREVTETTSDGVPSKPTRVRGFCSVVVWGEPSEPNGKIVGYDINFYDSNNPSRNNIVFGVTNTVYDVTGSSGVPDGDTEALYFQVRAKTSQSNGGGAGLWSNGIPLGCTDECVPPSPPECPSEPELMHFSLGGVDYPNNSIFYISDIGQSDSALLCVTNRTACCGSPNRFGEWLFPNGSMVPSSGSNWDFFRGRGDKIVRLSRRNDAMSPTGVYRCKVPDASGVIQTIQATLIGLDGPICPTPDTCTPCPTSETCPPEICLEETELITVSTIVNDLVILTSAEKLKDIIVEITVKFTLTDKPEISETITEDFVNPWVRVPSAILQIQQDSPVSVQVRPEFNNGSSGMFSLPATFTASESKALFEAVTSGECEPSDTMAFGIKHIIAVIASVVGTILIVCLIVLIIAVIIKCKKRKKSSLPSTYGTRAKDMELYNPTYKAT